MDSKSEDSPKKDLRTHWNNLAPRSRNLLKLIFLFFIVLALPLTVWVAQQTQNTQQKAAFVDQLEAEGGVLGGNAIVITDTNASGGKSVRFSASTPTPVVGGARYISPNGSDTTGNGTIGSPWATIRKWMTMAPQAGDTLYIRGGTYLNQPYAYSGHGTPGLLGTAAAPITIRNYPGETPIFSGGSNPLIGIFSDTSQSGWVVIDGIQCINRMIGSSGAIVVGGWPRDGVTGYTIEHITIRNFKFTMKFGDIINQSHGVYLSKNLRYATVEDSVFIGPGPGGSGGDGVTVGSEWSDDITVQRSVFKDFNASGMSVWGALNPDPALNFETLISHCSFINNSPAALRIEVHGPTTVRDSASTGPYVPPTPWTDEYGPTSGAPWILHYYEPIEDVIQSYNFFNQTFDANYYLTPGSSGNNAASDGKDAGALNN